MDASTETLLAPLLRSARLTELQKALHASLADEQSRRELFHDEIDDSVKAEFINGEIIMHSPAKTRHLNAVKFIARLLDAYAETHSLGTVFTEKALIRLPRNSYEPDICYFRKETADQFTPDQTLFPAPDLIVEVLSETTEHRDRGIKMEDYAAHGVSEYWLVDAVGGFIEQYLPGPEGLTFQLARKVDQGTLPSHALAGFILPVPAAFDPVENRRALLAILQ
ncbi:Uma2 family endonuclease [Phragmitibacter flavus]|uniref:Uma2 family endonuclease n=1 Tax=Phragmitibacter flavus TaxID=2576071 RepID=A0A5R8KFY5_9BACT|nr:Uma2 family endonuclease [Phragmitibacter flavus]TLD71193.1 Uma2 family endonuclease [Phragmitibacter flavus]